MTAKRSTVCLQTKTWGGGAGWFAQQLAAGMASAGMQVIYVAPRAEPITREPFHPNLTRIVTTREATEGSRLSRAVKSLARVRDGYFECLKARARTSTYLFSIPDPLLFFLPLQILLRLLGAQQHLVVHDALPHSWARRARPPFVHFAFLWLSYRLATRLVTTTTQGKSDLLVHFGIPERRTCVIPHGPFDLGVPSPIPGDRRLLVFGALRRNKRVLESIKAIQLCRSQDSDVELVIAGQPDKEDPAYWRECEAQIARAPAGISVELGYIPEERIPALIAACDAVLLPYEGFTSQSGVAILMATSERPVIATEIGGIADLFALGMAGIPLQEGAPAEVIAKAISRFFEISAGEWRHKARTARLLLGEELSWSTIGHSYAGLLTPKGRKIANSAYADEITSR